MSSMFHLSGAWLAAIAAYPFAIRYPVALATVALRRRGMGWRSWWFGAQWFGVFQRSSPVCRLQQ
jgi:hypothetical protein